MASQNVFKAVPTRAALLLKNKPEFNAIIFEEPKPSSTGNLRPTPDTDYRPSIEAEPSTRPSKKKDKLEFDIKKARHEIFNFALNGAQQKNKKKMQIVQAVKLGAKAPKKTYKNYKELQDEKRRLKTIREERLKFHQLGKNQTGAASVRCSIRKRVAASKQKKRAPVTQISKNYGVVKPKLKEK